MLLDVVDQRAAADEADCHHQLPRNCGRIGDTCRDLDAQVRERVPHTCPQVDRVVVGSQNLALQLLAASLHPVFDLLDVFRCDGFRALQIASMYHFRSARSCGVRANSMSAMAD